MRQSCISERTLQCHVKVNTRIVNCKFTIIYHSVDYNIQHLGGFFGDDDDDDVELRPLRRLSTQ